MSAVALFLYSMLKVNNAKKEESLLSRWSLHISLWIFLFGGLVLSVAPARAQDKCSEVFRPALSLTDFKAKLSPSYEEFIDTISSIPLDVMSGQNKPGWKDFSQLEKSIEAIKEVKSLFIGRPELQQQLVALTEELKAELLSDGFFMNLKQGSTSTSVSPVYGATEYELKRAFQFYIARLNKELPRELRLPLARIRLDQRRKTLTHEAEELVRNLEGHFGKVFHTIGYGDYANFEKILRDSKDPLIMTALELIDRDQIQIIMRRPENGRFWLPKTGFQNQFVTGSSKGSLSPRARNFAENNLYRVDDLAAYTEKDPELKPKYGTMRLERGSKVRSEISSSENYGPDIYTFKKDRIFKRLTFFQTDSLGPGSNSNPESWTSYFIPWSYRLLMVPFMLNELKFNLFSAGKSSPADQFPEIKTRTSCYWEAQIAGPVSLQDVAEFEFTKTPPSGEFLEELRAYGIKIWDGVKHEEWKGESP